MILKNHKLKNNDGIKVVIAFTRDISLGSLLQRTFYSFALQSLPTLLQSLFLFLRFKLFY